jgi:undecaprenyl-diphosphatase
LLLVLTSLGVFGAVAESVFHQGALAEVDGRLTAGLTDHAAARPVIVDCFGLLTQLGGITANTLLALVVAGVLGLRGQKRLALATLLLALAGALLDAGLKEFFQRPRPAVPTSWINETNYSFPSGHSMGSVVGYGLLVYLLLLPIIRGRRARAGIIAGVAGLVLLIGFSRVYLRAHYLSDVVAGFAAGTAWLVLSIAILDVLHRRMPARHVPALNPILAAGEMPIAATGTEEDLAAPLPYLPPALSDKTV